MFFPRVRRAARSDSDVPVVALLLAVVLVLLIGGGGVVFWGMRAAQMRRAMAMEAELRAMEEAEMARAKAVEAEAEAQAARHQNEQKVEDLLHPHKQHPAEEFLKQGLSLCGKGQINEGLLWFVRGLEQSGDDAALQRVFRANLAAWDDTRAGTKLAAQKGAVTALALSPDGKLVLTGSADGSARACQTDGQPAGEALSGEGKVTALGFGAGGKEWLVATEMGSRRLDSATRKPLDEPLESPGTVFAIGAKADGQVMMFGTCEQGTWLAPDGGQEGVKKLFNAESPVLSAALGRDVQLILTGHEDHQARVWDGRGKPAGAPLPHEAPVGAVAVSADGKWLATGAGQTVHLWDAATHQPVGRPLVNEADVTALAFTPDGGALLGGDQNGALRRWAVPAPVEGDAARLKLWAEVRAGKALDAAGKARPLDDKALQERRQKLQAAGGPPKP
jgi:WD40 repeat protein